MMPKTNTTPGTCDQDKDRLAEDPSAQYTEPRISDYGDLVEVTAGLSSGVSSPP